MNRFSLYFIIACLAFLALPSSGQSFDNFIRRDGDTLRDGDKIFRFISFNIPNLHYVEDDVRFDQSMPFRFPDAFEIDDALGSIEQIGGQVVRIYALAVKKPDDPADMPRYILGPGKFNEEAFVVLDQVIAAANRHHVRLIIPFIDQWSWWGGTAEMAGFRGKKADEIWSDPQLIDDYKAVISFVINRVNTVTKVPYRDDKAILGWESGNELKATDEWTAKIAAHVKSLDSNHLFIDGANRDTLSKASIDNPNIDFVQTHHYDKDPRDMVDRIIRNHKLAQGKKPYHVGEFGFLSTPGMVSVMDTVIDRGITGAMIWSLRYRTREGGFYWHHEPYGGDLFKSYHWSGYPSGDKYDERRFMGIVREKAFAIRGITPPPLPKPIAPKLLAVSPAAVMSWQGSAGASDFDIQRSDSADGPWLTIAYGVNDAQYQYRPLFVDESAKPGKSYLYRVIARNASGSSEPSNVVGPVRITHNTFVDELANDSKIFLKQGKFSFPENDARKFKEDCNRLSGEANSWIAYFAGDGISTVRVDGFVNSDKPVIRISFSKDGRTFEPAESGAKPTDTYGAASYGYWKATRIAAIAKPEQRFVKIEILGECQIGRIEVDHGRVD